MKPAINDASARRDSGGPSSVPSRGGGWENRPRSADNIAVERQIAELVDRSTEDLRVAWRELHRTGPPQGLSRDLLIRALAHRLQSAPILTTNMSSQSLSIGRDPRTTSWPLIVVWRTSEPLLLTNSFVGLKGSMPIP